MTQEETTPEQAVAAAQAGIADAQKALDGAIRSFAKLRDDKSVDAMALVAGAKLVEIAQGQVARSQHVHKMAENAVKTAEWTRRAAVLVPMQSRRIEASAFTDEERESCTALEVEGFTITIYADKSKSATATPFGPGIPKRASAPRGKSSNGVSRGGKWTFNGQSAREFLAQYAGQAITDRVSVDQVLAEPARYGLVDYARRYAAKVGVTPQPIE